MASLEDLRNFDWLPTNARDRLLNELRWAFAPYAEEFWNIHEGDLNAMNKLIDDVIEEAR